jgi:hypothetical protein
MTEPRDLALPAGYTALLASRASSAQSRLKAKPCNAQFRSRALIGSWWSTPSDVYFPSWTRLGQGVAMTPR